MLNLNRRWVVVTLSIVLITVGATAWQGNHPPVAQGQVHGSPPQPLYQTSEIHDPNGTGKFYMGREIALVMSPEGISWLDRPEREDEERPVAVIDALGLRGGEVVADLGAGSGFFTFRIAPKVGRTGRVLAVDIQDEMLETIRRRATALKVSNVEEAKASETDPRLPAGGVDIVLMVDVYHELAYPFEVMTKVREALKPAGRVVFVEYRKEDPRVHIKELHKMSVEQVVKEMEVVGLAHLRTVETLPLQHIVIFEKRERAEIRSKKAGAIVSHSDCLPVFARTSFPALACPLQKPPWAGWGRNTSNSSGPLNSDIAFGSEPVNQLSRMMLEVSDIVKVNLQPGEWEPMEP